MMPYTDEYSLVEVDADYLSKAVKPKQFIHIDQTECIACEGCVDICPWKCIHMVSTVGDRRGRGHRTAGHRPVRCVHVHHRRRHLHALCAVRRPLPHRGHHPRQGGQATAAGDSHVRTNNHGYGYGMRL
jgi:ferredoxin